MDFDAGIKKLTVAVAGILDRLNKHIRAGDYREGEWPTGRFWIDGKEIYRKTVSFALPSGAGTGAYTFSESSLSTIVSVNGFAYNSSTKEYRPLPMVSTTAVASQVTISGVIYSSTSSYISYTVAADYSAWTAYITVEYTKA